MSKRRTLGTALAMSDEKKAFIKGGLPVTPLETETPKVVELAKSQELVMASVETSVALTSPETLTAMASNIQSPKRSRVRNSRREPENAEMGMPGMANLLVPLTTRLSPATATALKRAGLEQKLYGRQPGTVQEIAEEAIVGWLREQGYL